MSLTLPQQDALEQLCAVTASDTAAARQRDEQVLRDNNWDVQRAVEAIFSGAASGTTEPVRSAPSGPSRSSSLHESDPMIPTPPPGSRRLSGSVGRRSTHAGTSGAGLWGLIGFPIKLVFSIVSSTWYFIVRTFIPLSILPRLPRFLLPPNGSSGQSRSRPPNPTADSLSFVRDLETFTGCSASTNSLPEFYIGPYREFMLNVRKEGKVGMVVILCEEHEDDEEFKRDVLCDAELVRTLKEKEIMVWGADVRSREGYQAAQTLLHTTYPSITFVSLLPAAPTSTSTSGSKLSVITSISGRPSTTTSASSILQTLTTAVLPRATPYLNRLKREKQSLAEARHLREEQDRAFKAAERKDREKAQKAAQEAELARLKLEREAKEAADKAKALADRRAWRRYARKHLLPESKGPLRIALRTPLNSERNVRNFQPGPSTLPLFIYAETLLIPREDDPAGDPDSPPEGYEPEYEFRIVTSFPRREIGRVESGGEGVWEVVKAAGGALFAEKMEGGDWGEAEARALNGDDSDEEVLEE